MAQIRWLHISDLHLGCRGGPAWWEARNDFERHVREVVEESGPPHLILFTGDLTNVGTKKEFEGRRCGANGSVRTLQFPTHAKGDRTQEFETSAKPRLKSLNPVPSDVNPATARPKALAARPPVSS